MPLPIKYRNGLVAMDNNNPQNTPEQNAPAPGPQDSKPETLTCPYCSHTMLYGATVCAGCKAKVEYNQPSPFIRFVLMPVCVIPALAVASSKKPYSMSTIWWGLGTWVLSVAVLAGIGHIIKPDWFDFKRVVFKRKGKESGRWE